MTKKNTLAFFQPSQSKRKSNTILVAVADPASSEQPAIERAAHLAAASGAPLVLFHAAFDAALSGRPFFDSTRLAKSRGSLVANRDRLLQKQARSLRARGLTVDVVIVWEEPAHEAIIRAAQREKVALVVAGRHTRRLDQTPRFRATDWELMRLCPQPLLVTGWGSAEQPTGTVLAALDPTHAQDKTASMDISIARHAAAIASVLGAECQAVHAVPDSAYPLGQVTAEARKRLHRRRETMVRETIAQAGVEVAAVHIVRGEVAQSLPAIVRQQSAQVLVMGIISRRWLKHFVLGDSAESVIQDLPCDLLLIKPDEFRLRLARARKEPVVLPKEKK